jgi:hypothetical protein
MSGLIPIIIGNSTPTPVGEHTVRYFDYDGTLLKTENLDDGGTLTPPSVPVNPDLIFNRWSKAIADYIFNGYLRAVPTPAPTDFPMTIEINGTVAVISISNIILTGTFIDNIIDASGSAPGFGTIVINGVVQGELFQGTWSATAGVDGSVDANLVDQGVYQDLDIGALYDTLNDDTYIYVTVTEETQYLPDIYIKKNDTSLLTVAWGDGTTSSTTANGDLVITKDNPYAGDGDYIIKITTSFYFYFGANINKQLNLFGSTIFENAVTKIYMSKYAALNNVALSSCSNLANISLPPYLTKSEAFSLSGCTKIISVIFPPVNNNIITGSTFASCYMLKNVILSDSIVELNALIFSGSYSIESIILPNSITTLGISTFEGALNLSRVILSDNIKTIPSDCFLNNHSLQEIEIPKNITSLSGLGYCYTLRNIYMLPTVPPTIYADTFTDINPLCKIWVPAESYDDYIVAEYWSDLESQIYVTE